MTVSRGVNTWDHHDDIFNTLANTFLPELDQAYATLLEDLHQRGMLDTTLVILTGEFGRTPLVNIASAPRPLAQRLLDDDRRRRHPGRARLGRQRRKRHVRP